MILRKSVVQNQFLTSVISTIRQQTTRSTMKSVTDASEEIKINVPWGHVAGKWWGPKNIRPILAIHGWQDNAGSFDTLAPLLPKNISLLAIDLPGHGLSSNLPNGIMYNTTETLHLIKRIKREYKWNKVSLMGHSMGALAGFMYSGIFVDEVDFMISLDGLVPQFFAHQTELESLKNRINSFLESDERNIRESKPPAFPYDEIVRRLHEGTFKSVTIETAQYLLQRAIKESDEKPNNYYFTRDGRLKNGLITNNSEKFSYDLAENLNIPYLYLRASKSPLRSSDKFNEFLEVMKKNSKFEKIVIEGTHHFHLTQPNDIIEIVNEFILKNRTEIN